jgi:hypothetical protein
MAMDEIKTSFNSTHEYGALAMQAAMFCFMMYHLTFDYNSLFLLALAGFTAYFMGYGAGRAVPYPLTPEEYQKEYVRRRSYQRAEE